MKPAAADIRAFVKRDRSRVSGAKRAHWSRTVRKTPAVAVMLAHALRDHAKTVSPEFSGPRSREEDFAHHLHLKDLIDRAARAFSIRRRPR